MHELDGALQHYGVKGMKWGVRRTDEQLARARGKLGQKLDSLKRERQWKKVLREVDKLSTKDINVVARRVGLENDLKRLSKKVGTSKDKQDYLNRAKMSNDELSRKVVRLRAKDNLYRNINDASREQREFGMNVVKVGGILGAKYAMNGSIGPKDIFDAIDNPNKASGRVKEDMVDRAFNKLDKDKKDILKETLKKVNKSKS